MVDDGSTDGTGDEARAHGAALVLRHDKRQGVGAPIRDGWKAGLERDGPYLALLSGTTSTFRLSSLPALDALLAQGCGLPAGLALDAGRATHRRQRRSRSRHEALFAGLQRAGRAQVTDATNGFRIFRRELLDDAKVNLDQRWLDSYDLEPYVLYRRSPAAIE